MFELLWCLSCNISYPITYVIIFRSLNFSRCYLRTDGQTDRDGQRADHCKLLLQISQPVPYVTLCVNAGIPVPYVTLCVNAGIPVPYVTLCVNAGILRADWF